MAGVFHPFFNQFAGEGAAAAVPLWTLIEAATAAGLGGPQRARSERPCSSRGRHGPHGHGHHGHGPQPCSSRQAEKSGCEFPTVGSQGFQEFLANAAAIAKALLEDDTPASTAQPTNGTKYGETMSAKHSENGFEITLDVSNFSPADLTVKTVDNAIIVEAKHGEKPDAYGSVERTFTRKIHLPEGVKPENVTCKMGTNGVLILSAPIIQPAPVTTERSIPINFTGVPAAVPASDDLVGQEQVKQKEEEVPMTVEDNEVSKLD